jgi:hypothetical protein
MTASNSHQRIWAKYAPLIILKLKQAISKNAPQEISLDSFDFTKSGSKTASYSFTLEYKDGVTTSNMKMTTVAREFAAALQANDVLKDLVKKGRFTFKMGSNFVLSIQKHEEAVPAQSGE